MSCFDIAHSQECQNLFTTISRNGKDYIRTIPSHKVVQDLEELYQQDLPRRSSRGRPAVPTFSQLILHHKVINASNTMESHGIKVTEEKAESAVTRVLNLSPPPRKNLLLMGTTTVESQGCLLGQRML